jgi:hypothetical protein
MLLIAALPHRYEIVVSNLVGNERRFWNPRSNQRGAKTKFNLKFAFCAVWAALFISDPFRIASISFDLAF